MKNVRILLFTGTWFSKFIYQTHSLMYLLWLIYINIKYLLVFSIINLYLKNRLPVGILVTFILYEFFIIVSYEKLKALK